MDDFLQLTDEQTKKRRLKEKVVGHANITSERIERLKKVFQPFWMRGMMPHKEEGETTLTQQTL